MKKARKPKAPAREVSKYSRYLDTVQLIALVLKTAEERGLTLKCCVKQIVHNNVNYLTSSRTKFRPPILCFILDWRGNARFLKSESVTWCDNLLKFLLQNKMAIKQ